MGDGTKHGRFGRHAAMAVAALALVAFGAWIGVLVGLGRAPADALALERRVKEVVASVAPSVYSVLSSRTVAHPGGAIRENVVGSAFVFRRRAGRTYLVTNFHVVENAETVALVGADGDRITATSVGADPTKDIAVLAVDADGLGAPLDVAGRPATGTFVLAIGSPYNFANTVTMGIVSSTERRLPTVFGYEIDGVIQTDAAVNQGNSGGPLVDLRGRVVGVNSAIFSLSGGYEGLGFAIPADEAVRVAERVIEEGETARRVFGITCADFDRAVANAFTLPVDGVLVLCLAPGSPLARAGVRPTQGAPGNSGFVLGDVITHVAGERVRSMEELTRALHANRGREVSVIIYREGRSYEVRVPVPR